MGRSALDAVELMNVGANFLEGACAGWHAHSVHHHEWRHRRQILFRNSRLSITFLRAESPEYLMDVAERLRNIAKGAAMMTDTTFEEVFESGFANMTSNRYLA